MKINTISTYVLVCLLTFTKWNLILPVKAAGEGSRRGSNDSGRKDSDVQEGDLSLRGSQHSVRRASHVTGDDSSAGEGLTSGAAKEGLTPGGSSGTGSGISRFLSRSRSSGSSSNSKKEKYKEQSGSTPSGSSETSKKQTGWLSRLNLRRGAKTPTANDTDSSANLSSMEGGAEAEGSMPSRQYGRDPSGGLMASGASGLLDGNQGIPTSGYGSTDGEDEYSKTGSLPECESSHKTNETEESTAGGSGPEFGGSFDSEENEKVLEYQEAGSDHEEAMSTGGSLDGNENEENQSDQEDGDDSDGSSSHVVDDSCKGGRSSGEASEDKSAEGRNSTREGEESTEATLTLTDASAEGSGTDASSTGALAGEGSTVASDADASSYSAYEADGSPYAGSEPAQSVDAKKKEAEDFFTDLNKVVNVLSQGIQGANDLNGLDSKMHDAAYKLSVELSKFLKLL